MNTKESQSAACRTNLNQNVHCTETISDTQLLYLCFIISLVKGVKLTNSSIGKKNYWKETVAFFSSKPRPLYGLSVLEYLEKNTGLLFSYILILTLFLLLKINKKERHLRGKKCKHSPLHVTKLKQVFMKNNNYVTIFRYYT